MRTKLYAQDSALSPQRFYSFYTLFKHLKQPAMIHALEEASHVSFNFLY